jgi:hypothetical protein
MDADVKVRVGFLLFVVMVVGVLGWGGRRGGNDDCHSEMRGSGPQDSVRS